MRNRSILKLRSALAAALVGGLSSFASAGFDTLEESFGLSNQLQVLALEVNEGSAGAVGRLGELWAGNGAGVVKREDGSVVSIAGWLEGLPAEQRKKLSDSVDAAFVGQVLPVTQMTASMPGATPLEIYYKSRGTAISKDVGPAIALAGDRARTWGDTATAADLYRTAASYGWAPTADAQTLIKSAGTVGTIPMPVSTTWYGQPTQLPKPRVWPVESTDGTTFIEGISGVLAMRKGAVAWTNTWGEPDDIAAGALLPGGAGRGTLLSPAALVGAGAAQVVIVNTPVTADLPGTLRAIRASDGKMLWESANAASAGTSSLDPMAGLRFVGPVTIAGRYVYAQAVRPSGTWATLSIVCLDVTNGRMLWQSVLGNVTDTARSDTRRPLEYHWHASAPVVSGDRVYVAPGVGYVFAIGRFDGLLRWARPYEVADAPEADVRKFREQLRHRAGKVEPPVHPLQAMRWAGQLAVANGIVLAAPLDTPGVIAIDARTGDVKWSKPEIDGPNLVGVSNGVAVFSGATLRGVDITTGNDKWTADAAHLTPTGPASVVGEFVHVPIADDVIRTLNVTTGNQANERASAFAPQRDAITTQLKQIGAFDALVAPAPKK